MDSVEVKEWLWENQAQTRAEWPQITTNQGTQISIAPRQYILQMKKTNERITKEQIQEMKKIITPIHNYKYAPEPLNMLTSTLQILEHDNERSIYLSLTNISSQIIRRKLFEGIMTILDMNYSPMKMWIIMGNADQTPKAYQTQNQEEVIKVLLTAQAKITEMELTGSSIPPWVSPVVVLLHHEAQNRDEAVKPERENVRARNTNQEREKKLKEAMINRAIQKRKREPSPAGSTSSMEMEELKQIQELEKVHTTPSSSTRKISKMTGEQKQPQEQNKPQASSHSTTTKISTSSSQAQQQEEMQQESDQELPNTLVQKAQELKNLLSHYPELDFSGDTFCIASVSVSKASISMEIKLKEN
uniref:Non-structural protein 2 n=1 Tax=Ambidensovirus sp. TaxID=2050976 RepID=A0A2P1G6B1_9VIRU|nr:non-structural protein 2 [Ambidensovirus sp.]